MAALAVALPVELLRQSTLVCEAIVIAGRDAGWVIVTAAVAVAAAASVTVTVYVPALSPLITAVVCPPGVHA